MDAHTALTISTLDWKRVTRFTSRRRNKRYYKKYCNVAWLETRIRHAAQKKRRSMYLGRKPLNVYEAMYVRTAERLLPPLGYSITTETRTHCSSSGDYTATHYFVAW